MVESGTIKTAASDFNKYGNSMATFAMDKEGRLLYEFWKTDIKLVNQDGTAIPIARYNTNLITMESLHYMTLGNHGHWPPR